ncbi:MAG: bifunctional acetate--CoA ligase family protein/GNAT family N-acetyltransferase [Gemmatimonadales bacterium]
MTVRNLDSLFRPTSVAVIGASNTSGSVGTVVFRNMLRAGFGGIVTPVNPRHTAVQGVRAYATVSEAPDPPDLAVICTPPETVPGLIGELGEVGTRAAVVLTAGLASQEGPSGASLQQEMLEAARPHRLRILGPNCVGIMVPGIGLNGSFAHLDVIPGSLAFVSQSGGLCTAVLDWASAGGIGFSHFVSLGDSADVDVGDVLDYLGGDPETTAILLYLESIDEARKFMSAARAAARNKPTLVIKSGRRPEGARAAASHTGALAGADEVYDAALSRTGMLRVFEIDELFDAVETLARAKPLRGDRLAVLTNGGGPGVMAADALSARGGRLAELADETIVKLDAVLPVTWSRGNPVDIIGDAPGERYASAMQSLLDDPGIDAILILHTPTALASGADAARAVVATVREHGAHRNVLTSWLGRQTAEGGREILRAAGIPTYRTPEHAVRAFTHMVRYRRNQELLMETPPSLLEDFAAETGETAELIDRALDEGRSWLTEPEAKKVLAAYGIPVVETRIAVNPSEAAEVASGLGFPVALKLLSPDVTHKSDVGGVALDLESAYAVSGAAHTMLERLSALRPEATVEGFTVQRMARRPRSHELIVGTATDPVFGPVILFGQGGTAVELIQDRAVALPPLNATLARELVSRTRVFKLLEGYRDRPPADMDAILETLIKLSQLTIDLPEVAEVDVNPLLADEEGVLALDARIRVATAPEGGADRLAIRPYPKELEETVLLRGGRTVLMRPIRPEDEPAHRELFRAFSKEDMRFRFFGLVRELPHSQMARYTQIDYDREMAFIATDPEGAPDMTLGVVRVVADPDNTETEFAIIIRSDMKGQGLGHALMDKVIRYCRDRGTGSIVGQVLPDNHRMLALAETLGFTKHYDVAAEIVEVRLELPRANGGVHP